MAARQLIFGDDARQRILLDLDRPALAARLAPVPRGHTIIHGRDAGARQPKAATRGQPGGAEAEH